MTYDRLWVLEFLDRRNEKLLDDLAVVAYVTQKFSQCHYSMYWILSCIHSVDRSVPRLGM